VNKSRRDYYPRYYREKRRRERIVLGVTVAVVVLLVLGGIALPLVYLLMPRADLEQFAERLPEITEASSPAAVPASPPVAPPAAAEAAPLLALEDVTEYGISVPELSLIPEGLGGGGPAAAEPPPPQVTEEAVSGGEVAAPAVEVEQPPAEGESPARSEAKKEAGSPPKRPQAPKQAGTDGEKAGQDRPETPKPQPQPKPKEPVYSFIVYAGVFDSEAEAGRQRERLSELGFQSTLSVRSRGEKKVYYLQVGSALSQYEPAEAVKNKLAEAGFANPFVLRREG